MARSAAGGVGAGGVQVLRSAELGVRVRRGPEARQGGEDRKRRGESACSVLSPSPVAGLKYVISNYNVSAI